MNSSSALDESCFCAKKWVSDDEPEAPEATPRSLGQAPPSLDYVPGTEHPPSPDYVPGLEYLEYLVPFDYEVPIKDQPLPVDALLIALSSGYVADSNPEEDPDEDPKEDPMDYPAEEDPEEAFEEDEDEEEEHLALADSVAPTPSPPRSPYTCVSFAQTGLCKARKTVRLEPPMAASTKALIAEYTAAPALPSPPSSPLSPWSSLLLQIPSPPLLLPSPPTHTSLTYEQALVGYRAAMIQWTDASPSTHHPSEIPSPPLLLPSTSYKDDIPESDMPLQKRAHFTAPASRFEVGESLSAAAARQTGHTLSHRVDYGFVDIVVASIRDSEDRVMTIVGGSTRGLQILLLLRGGMLRSSVCIVWMLQRPSFIESLGLITDEREEILSLDGVYEREATKARQVWAQFESRSQAMEAQISALQRDVSVLHRQRITNVNGDSVSPVASASTGAEGPIPPKIDEQKLARKNELKAKSTLMLVIPDEHLLKFHAWKDVNSLWEAIKNRFRVISQEDANLKLLRSSPSSWNNIALIMRNKSDLDTLSMDDFGTNETVNIAHSVSVASFKDQASTASYVDDVMFSFFSNQSNALQLDYEDLEQIDANDLEEMDLKW
ncbi:hypothetical protein Tco_0726798 [Tanacetum coccineum]|uniref:Uncharacterized protein n=1 Tax=Tanacetum coccineum TaxID=301880 RepID=A0ABQ4YJ40_9ASTR